MFAFAVTGAGCVTLHPEGGLSRLHLKRLVDRRPMRSFRLEYAEGSIEVDDPEVRGCRLHGRAGEEARWGSIGLQDLEGVTYREPRFGAIYGSLFALVPGLIMTTAAGLATGGDCEGYTDGFCLTGGLVAFLSFTYGVLPATVGTTSLGALIGKQHSVTVDVSADGPCAGPSEE